MSKEQGHRLIDIIRWGQLFVEGKGKDESLKKLIVKAEANMSRLYISVASEGIKRAIKEKMTDAIFYNPEHEIYRLLHLKEITREEYENNPVKKAHDEYAGEIKYRVGDLDIASVLWAITANNSVPDYKTALKAALDRAEQHIATICKETGCAADIAAFITRGLIERVCKIVFDVYHPKEFDELQSRIEQYTAQWFNLFEQLKGAKTEEEKDHFRAELDKAEKEFNSYCAAYDRKIDRAEGVDEITAAIIKRLFPNEPTLTDAIEKAKETAKESAHEIGQYLKMPQGTHTNNLARRLATKKPTQIDLNGKASIIGKDFRLYIEGYDKLVNGANTSAAKLFDAFVMVCSRNRNPLARIPLKEYMELRGLRDEKEARKQIKADMEVLKAVKLEYRGTGKSRGDWLSLSLYGGRAGIYKGVIEFRFTPEFYASIPEDQFMFIPRELFSTRDKYNPHSYYFIRRIAEHKRMNLGKPNENIIGVETLVNSSPTFPKYEDVNYRFTQFILEPFERDMDAIKSIKWHYAGEQPTNYNEFITSSVVITWVDYPDDEVKKLTQRKKHSVKEKRRSKRGGNGVDLGG